MGDFVCMVGHFRLWGVGLVERRRASGGMGLGDAATNWC